MEIDKYMSVAEAAHRWGVPQETVKNKLKPSIVGQETIDSAIKKGIIKFFQKPGGRNKDWIISEAAMKMWFGEKRDS